MNRVLEAVDLRLSYGAQEVLRGASLAVERHKITAIIGANACGKSTLLRALARLLTPQSGAVLLNGAPIDRLAPKALARQIGVLPQTPIAPDGITVLDLVSRGRTPHQGFWGGQTAADRAAVARAMAATETLDLADCEMAALSGGQRQRVWIAMALAQEPAVLLLDEPTTYLDINHQIELLDLLKAQAREMTIVMVLHELNLAARYADHLVAMRAGAVYAAGAPEAVMVPQTLRAVFGLESTVIGDPVSGRPMMIPHSRAAL